jgi:hypothetical protein
MRIELTLVWGRLNRNLSSGVFVADYRSKPGTSTSATTVCAKTRPSARDSGTVSAPSKAQRYGAPTAVLDWRERLVCSRCGGRQIDMVATGERRR